MAEKILLMLENKANRNVLKAWIKSKYDVILFDSKEQLNSKFDLGIVDGPMFKRYYEAIDRRKNAVSGEFLPFLLTISRSNIHMYRNQFWTAIDEVIFTPIEKVELAVRIEMLIRTRRLSLETIRLAVTDPLTKLYNRRHFFALTDREMARLKRKDLKACVFMMDIDHFKNVNDTYGHAVGDRVLESVSAYIRKNVRSYDILARYGGEEFVLFLPDADISVALPVAERIREQIASHPIPLNDGRSLSVTISIGCAETDPKEDKVQPAIERADKALYRAKDQGRNRVVVYEEE